MIARHHRKVGLVELAVDGPQPAVERHFVNNPTAGRRRVHQVPLAIGRRLVMKSFDGADGGKNQEAHNELLGRHGAVQHLIGSKPFGVRSHVVHSTRREKGARLSATEGETRMRPASRRYSAEVFFFFVLSDSRRRIGTRHQ